MEFGAASDSEIMSWYTVIQDVIELLRAINGDEAHAQPGPATGERLGDEGWYTKATGRVALYTRLYNLQTLKRESASLPAMTMEQVENSFRLEQRNATLASELEEGNKDWGEESRTMKRENASLSTTMKEQVEISRSLEDRNAALTTELEKRNQEDEEMRQQLQNRLDRIDQLETENRQLEATTRRHDDTLSNLRQRYEDGMRGLRVQVEDERRYLELAKKDFRRERRKLQGEKARLEDEAKCFEIVKDDFEKARGQDASTISRLEAELNNTVASLGSVVSLPERPRQALGSIAGTLESVLEECVICCELLLSGAGTPSFGVMSYSCDCSRSGHVRTLHVNCVVSMSNLKCPMCSEAIVLVAPSLMSPTAVRRFPVKKRP